jgi:hypothetical protein
MKSNDPRIKEWRDGIPFDENGKIIRGVLPTDEELKEVHELIDTLPVDSDNDPKIRPWLNYLSI